MARLNAVARRSMALAVAIALAIVAAPGAGGSTQRAASASWLAPETLSPPGTNTFAPRVAMNPAGDALAMWMIQDDSGQYVVKARFRPAAGDWSAIASIGTTVCCGVPAIDVAAGGRAVIAWREGIGSAGHVRAALRGPGTDGAWSEAFDVTPVNSDDGDPLAAIADDGSALVVTERGAFGSRSINVIPVTADGAPRPLQTISSGDSYEPRLAMNGNGQAAVVWQTGADDEIAAAFRGFATAPFAPPVAVTPASDYAYYPAVALNDQGEATVTWTATDDAGTQSEQVRTRTYDDVAASPPVASPEQRLSTAGRYTYDARVAVGDGDRAVVGFIERDPATNKVVDIRAAVRPDGTKAFPAPETTPAEPRLNEHSAHVAMDAAGDAVMIWHQTDSSPSDDVVDSALWGMAFRHGSETFGPHVKISSEGDGTSDQIDVAIGGHGDAIASWDGAGVRVAGYATGPAIEQLSGPVRVEQGESAAYDARVTDVWGHVRDSSWTFSDDGATVPGAHADKLWRSPGSWQAAFSTADDLGFVVGDRLAVDVAAPPPSPAPVAVIDAPARATYRHAVVFSAARSTGDAPLSFLWDFDGDRQVDEETADAAATHVYPGPGTRHVTLQVRDARGQVSDPAVATLEVAGVPAIELRQKPALPTPGDTVTFTLGARDEDGRRVNLLGIADYGASGARAARRDDATEGHETVNGVEIRGGDPSEDGRWAHRYGGSGTGMFDAVLLDKYGGAVEVVKQVPVAKVKRRPIAAFTFVPNPYSGQQVIFDAGGSVSDCCAGAYRRDMADAVNPDPLGSIGKIPGTLRATHGARAAAGLSLTYHWDFDGDGKQDLETKNPVVEHAFSNASDKPKKVSVSLRVSDPSGEGVARAKITVLKGPTCGAFKIRGIPAQAVGQCLVPVTMGPSSTTSAAYGVLPSAPASASSPETTHGAIRLAGLKVLSFGGLVVDAAAGTIARFPGSKAPVQVFLPDGVINKEAGFTIPKPANGAATLPGFLSGAGAKIYFGDIPFASGGTLELTTSGEAKVHGNLQLPQPFSGTSPAVATIASSGGASAHAARAPAARAAALSVKVPDVELGAIRVQDLTITSDANGTHGGGTLVFRGLGRFEARDIPPPLPDSPSGFGFGKLSYAGAGFVSDNGIPLVPPPLPPTIGLKRLKLGFVFKPYLLFDGHIGLIAMEPLRVLGIPLFEVSDACVTFVVLPASMGGKDVRYCDGLVAKTAQGGEEVMRVAGVLYVAGIKTTRAAFDIHHGDSTWADFGANMRVPIRAFGVEIGHLDGNVEAKLESFDRWQAKFDIGGSLLGVSGSISALASNVGIGGCLDVLGVGVGGWTRWDFKRGDRAWGGCDFDFLKPIQVFKALPSAAQLMRGADRATAFGAAAGTAITLDHDSDAALLSFKGDAGAPQVTIAGPGGREIADTGASRQRGDGYAILKAADAAGGVTFVIVRDAKAGRYEVTPAPGSPAITDGGAAPKLPEPRILASVARARGRGRMLRYQVDPQPGLKVTFAEQGASSQKIIGVAQPGRHTITFVPAEGAARTRKIVALVERGGIALDNRTLARFTAPAPWRPGRPMVRARARKGMVTIRWTPVAGTRGWVVRVRGSDGRRESYHPGRDAGTLTLRAVPPGTRLRIAVSAVTAGGKEGPAGGTRLTAGKRSAGRPRL